jgi:hypothetical protein
MELSTDTIMDREGTYCSREKNLCIEITIEKDIVKYMLKDTLNRVLFSSSKPSISHFHNWGLLLDAKNSIWVHSSDIGLFVLRKNAEGNYDLSSVDNIKNAPASLIAKYSVYQHM